MKKSAGPLVVMTLVCLLLALSSFAQKTKKATASVSETITFDYTEDRYLSSKDGEVDNFYTTAQITEKGDKMTFVLHRRDGLASIVSQYVVVKRRKNGNIIIARRVGDNAQIRIDQTSKYGRIEVHCDHKTIPNRYDGVIVFTNLKFM